MNLTNIFFKSKTFSLLQLREHCAVLDDYIQERIIGTGYKYIFDRQGNIICCIDNEFDYDQIEVSGSTVNPFPLSGTLGSPSPNTNYPQSGVSFSGTSIDSGVFRYLAQNTDVEWAYCYKHDGEGGLITTSNQEHGVGIPSVEKIKEYGYDSIVHNHGQNYSGVGSSPNKVRIYNSHPSSDDIQQSIEYGFKYNYIYNEFDNKDHRYYDYTESQETIADQFGWDIEH